MKKLASGLSAAFALVCLSAPAHGQDDSGRGWIVTVGPGAQIRPDYPGADSYGFSPFPNIGVRREGQPMTFEAPDDSFGIGVFGNNRSLDFGPVARFVNKRDQDDVGANVGNVGFTVEVGGFAHAFIGDNLRIRAEVRQGLGGHEGLVGDLGADLILRDGDQTIFSIGPRLRWADNDYHDAYFGVTPGVAAATGLPAYDPGPGIHAIGARAGLTQRLGRSWGLYGYAGYDRLVGDAADSPIVRTFGSRDQFSGGFGLFFEFRVR